MKVQVFTHCLYEKNVRRFFVSQDQNALYHKVEREIDRIIDNKLADGSYVHLSLKDFHGYVILRIASHYMWEIRGVDPITLRFHLLDYADVQYVRRIFRLPGGISYRMYRYSEPLAINRRK